MPIAHFMHANEQRVGLAVNQDDGGVSAVESEFAAAGTADDRFCLQYVLYGKTGDAAGRRWANGVMDVTRAAGLTLDYFVRCDEAVAARLSRGHVLVLRLYSTAAFASLNNPLRDPELSDDKPHPFPVTVHLLTDAIKRLRAVEGEAATSNEHVVLWRGMSNRSVPAAFLASGGSEKAPMVRQRCRRTRCQSIYFFTAFGTCISLFLAPVHPRLQSTTHDLSVAVRYSQSTSSVLLRLETESFRERGADLTFLSAFPAERECLFPPLTHMRPVGAPHIVHVGALTYTVLDVKPSFG